MFAWDKRVADRRIVAALVLVLAGGVTADDPPRALVDLEWRPAHQTVLVGQTVSIGLYAVSSDPEMNQAMAAMDVILEWDAPYLTLLGRVDNGPYTWLFSGFPNDSTLDGLNNTWLDGDALYSAYSRFGAPAYATPAGLLVTTMRFTALTTTPQAVLAIPESVGLYTHTAVYDGQIPGLDIHGQLGSATVRILTEPPPGDCNLDLTVDVDDYSALYNCLTGPDDGPIPSPCQCADLDEDEDVDLADVAAFQLAFTGT